MIYEHEHGGVSITWLTSGHSGPEGRFTDYFLFTYVIHLFWDYNTFVIMYTSFSTLFVLKRNIENKNIDYCPTIKSNTFVLYQFQSRYQTFSIVLLCDHLVTVPIREIGQEGFCVINSGQWRNIAASCRKTLQLYPELSLNSKQDAVSLIRAYHHVLLLTDFDHY